MYANFLKYYFRKLINLEWKGNFKCLKVANWNVYIYYLCCLKGVYNSRKDFFLAIVPFLLLV